MKKEVPFSLSKDKHESNPLQVLFISYDGLLEPLGQIQILPYLEELSGKRV